MKGLVLFLFLASNVYGLCVETNRSIYAPAIGANGEGELVQIEVYLGSGDGGILFSVPPYVGLFTQSSVVTATKVAFNLAKQNQRECSVVFQVDPRFTETIDGPSGGGALTLMILSALQNKTIREDMSMTGTIEENGDIGPVGGTPEKLEAAAISGIRVFLVPKQDRDNKLALFVIKNKYNVSVIEVNNIQEAGSIAFLSSGVIVESNLILEKNKIPRGLVTEIGSNGSSDSLYKVGKSFTNEGEKYVEELNTGTEENKQFIEFFKNELNIANQLLDEGYVYTGANTAFLATVDLKFLGEKNITTYKINESINEISRCVNSIGRENFTEKNFELQLGSELRKNWALKKLKEVNNTISNQNRVFSPYHEVLFAEAWCNIAKSLQKNGEKGRELQENRLKNMAFEKIEGAENILRNKSFAGIEDLTWHLDTAKQAYNRQEYGAAIFDATYAASLAEATEDAKNMEPFTLKQKTGQLLGIQTRNFWSSTFKTHSKYYYARYNDTGEIFDLFVAYRLASYSIALENTTDGMRKEFYNENGNVTVITLPVNQVGETEHVVPKFVDQLIFPAILVMLVINLALQLYLIQRLRKQ